MDAELTPESQTSKERPPWTRQPPPTPTRKPASTPFFRAQSIRTSTADLRSPRALDHLDLVRQLSDAGFAAVVTKDHDYAGVATAALITKHHPELRTKIFSGIALNNVVGGINPYAVEHTAAMGGKIVWMPTL